ncbi:hypothetical protein CDES_02670 [Corynebacterium deserti GIMN1.010]|uniref:Uncharacterized protein n=1 Tax=Corynebacterium deserti GIMN1.010 TaxID=931089 RepID=A0A0M3Q936_9CORY|nr:hypothetical protein [Corynebacterium deserti]ALC04989.1 hypothetical protein CDES_02670 [Corynebacterium deserti GIMN1.010]
MTSEPRRIPAVLQELQATWEGQPDLSLTALFGILNTHGVGWGADDDLLIQALRTMREEYPATITGPRYTVDSRFVVSTRQPDNIVTIDPFRVVVRPAVITDTRKQPGIWEYSHIECTVGGSLILTDADDFAHNLGQVQRIRRVTHEAHPETPQLTGVNRQGLGEQVYLLVLIDGSLILLDSKLRVFEALRREVKAETLTWKKILTCVPGEPLRVRTDTGDTTIGNAAVAKIIPLE